MKNKNNVTEQHIETTYQAAKWWEWTWWVSLTFLIIGFGLWLGGVI